MSASLVTPSAQPVFPVLPVSPSGKFPLICDASWEEMFDGFIVYARDHELATERHERPLLFKDRATKVIYEEWKKQWVERRIAMLDAEKDAAQHA